MHAITLLQNTIKDYLTLLFVLLPYEFTLLQNLKRRLKLLPVHVSQDIQLHLIISPPFCQKHIDYHICASLFNYPAILYLFKCLNRHLKLLPAQMHEITLLQNQILYWCLLSLVLLPYEFTLLQNLKRGYLKLLPVHVSQDFQLHLIISPSFCQKHIDYHICVSLFNYPAILHLFKCLNRHLKLLPAQNARNYTTPKLI